ncbi:MAG: hypothetical protein IPM35_23905 [Myxococcales bacterium]|nr:hypothetical protein [Myxococcales bacterium]
MTATAAPSAITPLAGVPPRARHAVFALIAFVALSNAVGTALSPYLVVEHPLWLVAISPEGRHVVLAAPSVPAALLVVVGTLRRLLGIVAGFGLGLLYGEAAVRWAEQRAPRFSRFILFLERMFARFGVYLLFLVPLPSIGVLAGAARTRWPWVLVAGAAGQLVWMTLTVFFGEAVSGWTRPILAFLSRHLVESTIVAATLVGLQQLVAYQKRKSARAPES